jgi:exonuclease III
VVTAFDACQAQAVEKRIKSYLEQGRRVLLVGDLNIRRLPIDSKGTAGTEEESATW